jgi:predicted nucleic acid-binding protein
MLKKLIDTNIFIDRFQNPEQHRDIFTSEGVVYLSAVVFMELLAGAHTKNAAKAVYDLYNHFRRLDRLVVPSATDYERVGDILDRKNNKGHRDSSHRLLLTRVMVTPQAAGNEPGKIQTNASLQTMRGMALASNSKLRRTVTSFRLCWSYIRIRFL